jgi:Holliday junction resolvasome RuvABC endonuclease subunit
MAKINPYELINQQYTNANDDTYTVKAYIGKDSKLKHLYTIQFNDTKHEQHEERTKIIKSKCRDLMKEKANKSKIKQIKLKERARLSKKHEAEYRKFTMQDVPILALDQASNTGYCVILNNAVKKYGLIEKKYEDFYLNACYLVAEVTKLIIKYNIKIVFIEDIFLGLNAITMERLAGLKGMMISCAILNSCEYEVIHSTSWKTYHQLGFDRKEQKERSIELAKKILNNAEIDDNIADAVLIGVFAAKTLRSD